MQLFGEKTATMDILRMKATGVEPVASLLMQLGIFGGGSPLGSQVLSMRNWRPAHMPSPAVEHHPLRYRSKLWQWVN